MTNPTDIIGQKFGRLTVINTYRENGRRVCVCRCSCGTKTYVDISNLYSGNTRSCGCLAKETRQLPKTPEEIKHLIAHTVKHPRQNNTSGRTGVRWKKDRSKWLAEIRFNGVRYHLGYYTELQDAIGAREAAEIKLFGHILTDD